MPRSVSWALAHSPAAATSAPAPPKVVEYAIPGPGSFPHDPAVGADGSDWYTDQSNSYIGRLDPGSRAITDYPTPTPLSGPHRLVVAAAGIVPAPDGSIWIAQLGTNSWGA